MGSNLVIVAIPAADDPVWKISSEKIPHLTLLSLGDAENNPKINQIFQFVWHAVNVAEHGPFYLDVDRRDVLGEDKADVLHFRKKWEFKWIDQFRNQLLQNSDVRTAYDSVEQFPEWWPHLTLGYPETPANEDEIPDHGFGTIRFDRIAVWTGNYEGPQFRLEWPEREGTMSVAYSETGQAAVEELLHVGVKGMRWGVRKDRITGAAKATGKFIGDVHFESRAGEDQKARFGIEYQASRDFANKDLPRINAKPEYQAAKKRTHRLRNPIDPVVRQYRNEAKQTYINRLETTANSMKNPSGTREYTIRERGGDLPDSKYIWEVSTRQARHADGEDILVVEVIMNKDGFITKLNPVVENKSLEQTIDLGAEFLAHYGVKGMRWGQRKQEFVTRQHQQRLKVEAANRNARSPQEVKAYPTIGSSKRKKATVDTKGGEDHPPTEDAIKVAVAKQKLKKSGTAALTNSELQEMQRRLNLENDVQRLLTGDKTAGQRFIDGLLGRGSKEDRKSVENQVGQKTSALVAPTAVKIAKKAIVR